MEVARRIDLKAGGKETISLTASPVSSLPVANILHEASYICGECGEEVVIPIDLSAGAAQQYVEDCPVCCRANVIHVEIDDAGQPTAWAELE